MYRCAADNYDVSATDEGCLNISYDANATDDGTCEYAEDYYDCDGTCISDYRRIVIFNLVQQMYLDEVRFNSWMYGYRYCL